MGQDDIISIASPILLEGGTVRMELALLGLVLLWLLARETKS